MAAAVLALAGGFAAGCGEEGGMQPTMTGSQAAVRVEEVLQETFRQLPPGAQLRPYGDTGTLPCDDPTDGGPAGRVFVEQQYEVVHDPQWPVDQVVPLLAAHWEEQGLEVVTDLRAERDPQLSVEHPDGFRVGIEVYPRADGSADVYLVGSSPCVWPEGSPPAG